MKRRTLAFAAVALLFALLGILIGHWATEPEPAEPDAVTLMFAQSLPDAQGREQALAQWKNRPLVVNFWATWCAPCVEEMPELMELHQEMAAQGSPGGAVLGIGIDSADNIARFAEKLGIDYPLFVTGAGGTELSRRFGNKAGGLPFTVLVDADGRVRKTYMGRLKMDELRRDLSQL